MEREKIVDALRQLVKAIHEGTPGPCGGAVYMGDFEADIQAVATAIAGEAVVLVDSSEPDFRAMRAAVDIWNATHDIGTPVIVTPDDGPEFKSRTRRVARVLGGRVNEAVIWLDGSPGCYSLDRVRFDDETLIR